MALHVDFDLLVSEKQDRVEFTEPQSCALTEAAHVSISGPVTVNGVDCSHHTHLFLTESGEWQTKSRITGNRDIFGCNLRRMGSHDDPSFAAKDRALKNIPGMLSLALSGLADIDEKRLLAHQRALNYRHEQAVEAADDLRDELRVADELRAKLTVDLADANDGKCPSHKVFE